MTRYFLLSVLFFLYGCSVVMAFSGKKGDDVSQIKQEITKKQVEDILGKPKNSIINDYGEQVNLYEYDFDNKKSVGRASFYTFMNLITIGAWELVGTPIEYYSSKKGYLQITYDKENKVVDVKNLGS